MRQNVVNFINSFEESTVAKSPIINMDPEFNQSYKEHDDDSSYDRKGKRAVDVKDPSFGKIADQIPQKPISAQEDALNSVRARKESLVDIKPVELSGSVKFWTWFSPYRQMMLLVILIQILMILVTFGDGWAYPRTHTSAMVSGNLLVATAVRSEWVLRFVYWISIKLFRGWSPMKLRVLVVAILYHIGGLHSGCGVGAMMWLVVATTFHLMHRPLYHGLVTGTLVISLIIVVITCFVATPLVRAVYHNTFEITHRFLGWAGIISSLAFVISESWWDVNTKAWKPSGFVLLKMVEIWHILIIIILILGQWITVRKVPVEIDAPSNKVSVIKVPGGLTSGLHTRISRTGLREWHIFGSVSEGKKSDFHYMVIAVQGGFTRGLNKDQPAKLYTKTWKPCGLPYFSRLFTKGVAICTGSGIGAVGSTCIQHKDWYLIWIGSELEKTYGHNFVNFLKSRIEPERLLIWDTKGPLGRPDVNFELERVYNTWNAQVALFIGSPSLNKNVLETSRARGIPVFGSIWDA
ncbi:hypothetical protein BY996DRAFT_4612396 [Phakopsora pachyrhizi]|uniref:Uncharacterized protein n=1 Tax=Phakopsora pachyrhizi TaxID=170000 RepID=A0AAV0BT99_PHAPC|nr:hypothetical protein BY996DRAFT_4612396 [Phakopsora pachyrhizi]CAH7690014.1 hypothetical protein PPACK8108_LOCUS25234 [Phakopsora pachyrhizi]